MIFAEDEKTNDEREEFIKNFENEKNCSVKKMELVELRGGPAVYEAMEIKMEKLQVGVWGIIIATDKGNWFYSISQKNNLWRMFGRPSEEKPKETMFCLDNLKDAVYQLPRKKLLSFLNPEAKRTIDVEFTDASGKRQFFNFITGTPAQEIFSLLSFKSNC